MPNNTTTDPRTTLEAGIAQLEYARKHFVMFLEPMSDEEFVATPIGNFHNPYYIAGHIAWADLHFIGITGGEEHECETGDAAFGYKVDFNPDTRPCTREELMSMLTDAREKLVAHLRSLTDEQLAAPMPEGYEEFAPNVAGIAQVLGWHESMHTGQLTALRRAQGHPPLFG